MSETTFRKCNRCKGKDETLFGKNKKTGEFLKRCIECSEKRIIEGKKYRENNVEKIKERKKQYYEKNKEHCNEKSKQYYENNNEKFKEHMKQYYENNKENLKEQKKQYYENNKEKLKEQKKQYREDNKEKLKEQKKQYYEDNKENLKEQKKQYYKDKRHHCEHGTEKRRCKICDPQGHLKYTVSLRVHTALKANKSKKSIEYLGCDIETFKKHIESQFTDGMTWDKHGSGEGCFHIDHIIPIKYGNPTIEEVMERLHWSNTQPLWAKENISKGNRYIG